MWHIAGLDRDAAPRGRGSHKIGIVFYGKHARNAVVKQKTLLWPRSLRHTQYKDLDTQAATDTDTDTQSYAKKYLGDTPRRTVDPIKTLPTGCPCYVITFMNFFI